MDFAASLVVARKLSSVMGVRANPTIAYRAPKELCCAKSYSAGRTLRFAKSPDAPNSTTVHGSTFPPYADLERVASSDTVHPIGRQIAG
jgi:hypothetical protein